MNRRVTRPLDLGMVAERRFERLVPKRRHLPDTLQQLNDRRLLKDLVADKPLHAPEGRSECRETFPEAERCERPFAAGG